MNEPSRVFVQGDAADGLTDARPAGARWSAGWIEVEWTADGDVRVSSSGEISRVALAMKTMNFRIQALYACSVRRL